MELPELLAPAGGMEQLLAALRFGADAVYVGMKDYGLRAHAGNFDLTALAQAVATAHGMGKRLYVTLNILAKDGDLDGMLQSARDALGAGVDAVIVSDPGVVTMLRAELPQLPLHLSTQASTLNSLAANFWHQQGVERVIVGREMSLAEIALMRQRTPASLSLEAFVHGAMCMAYSGRCLISSALTGRSANKGGCTQPCRWGYELHEAGSVRERLPIEEDERGTYVLSARDLCMIEHLDKLCQAGLSSLKIEGRMKGAYYVATVVGAYRRALEAYEKDPAGYGENKQLHAGLIAQLRCASHRAFDTGFYFGPPKAAGGAYGFTQGAEYIANVLAVEPQTQKALLEVKNRFFVGDALELMKPGAIIPFIPENITTPEGEALPFIAKNGALVVVKLPQGAQPGDLVRGPVRNHVQEAGEH